MRLAIRAWGEEGSPLAVLVHGVTASSRTWWRVGPWLASRGLHAVAVDLRGHGGSPRITEDLGLEDLAEDLYETISGLPGERVDVLLAHSLGALVALELCQRRGDLVGRLVLEEPPGSESTDFEEIARGVDADAVRAREAPEAFEREQLAENPLWSEEDSAANAESMRECDAGPVTAMLRKSLRYDLEELVGSGEVPALLILGNEARGSALPEPERTSIAGALSHGRTEVFDAGHGVHRDDYEGYIRLLEDWLRE